MRVLARASLPFLVATFLWCQPGIASSTTIAGIILNNQGQPLADVRVQVKTGSMGDMLWWAFEPSTNSGLDGKFELTVPFGDILYRISAEKAGFLRVEAQVIPDGQKEIRVELGPNPRTTSITGHLIRPGGRTVPGAEVRLFGESGRRASATTDEDGIFTWGPLPDYIGQAVPLVRWEGLVSPIRIIRDDNGYVSINLVPPARLTGVCREKDSGVPVVGATVIMRPWFLSGFRLETTSKDDGTFELDGVPPCKYRVTAVSSTHFIRPPRGYDSELPGKHLRSGETTSVTLDMQPMATLEGRVLSPDNEPVPGALVCMRSTWLGDYRDQNVYVETDQEGRFSIATGHLDTDLMMEAFGPEYGLGRTEVDDLTPGQILDNVDITLAGATTIRGMVTDPEHAPLSDIVCLVEYPVYSRATTGPDGKFDLGRVSFRPDSSDPLRVTFRAPRPKTGTGISYGYDAVAIESRENAPRFFFHRMVEVPPEPKDKVHLDVVLQPTDLLEIVGTVLDASGGPVSSAQVHLLTGEASPETWLDVVRPLRGNSLFLAPRATLLDSTRTDDAGRFRFWTVRENGEATPMGGRNTDWASYCVGVESSTAESKLVRGIAVPEGAERREVTIRLGE